MPMHDWTRVSAGTFHAFHNAWISHLQEALNAGLLPPPYYALGEQNAGAIGPDVLALKTPRGDTDGSDSVRARHEVYTVETPGAHLLSAVDAPPDVSQRDGET